MTQRSSSPHSNFQIRKAQRKDCCNNYFVFLLLKKPVNVVILVPFLSHNHVSWADDIKKGFTFRILCKCTHSVFIIILSLSKALLFSIPLRGIEKRGNAKKTAMLLLQNMLVWEAVFSNKLKLVKMAKYLSKKNHYSLLQILIHPLCVNFMTVQNTILYFKRTITLHSLQ